MVTTVGEEKRFNPRLGLDKSVAEFVALMNQLDLAYPKKIEIAVPANMECGRLATPISDTHAQPAQAAVHSVASVMEEQGRQDAEIYMGLGI
jgi:hypothetical protein